MYHKYSIRDFINDFYVLTNHMTDIPINGYTYLGNMSQKKLMITMNIFTIMSNANPELLLYQDNIRDVLYMCDNTGCDLIFHLVNDLDVCGILTVSTFDFVISKLLYYNDTQRMYLVTLIHSITRLNRKMITDYLHDILNIQHDENYIKLLLDTSDILSTDTYGTYFFYKYFRSIFKLDINGVLYLNTIIELCIDHRMVSSISNIPVYEMVICNGIEENTIPDTISLESRKNILVALRNSQLLNGRNVELLSVMVANEVYDVYDKQISQRFLETGNIIIQLGIQYKLTQQQFDMLIFKFNEIVR